MYKPEIIEAAPELTPLAMERVSPAAIYIVRSQLEKGDDTIWDHFLWDNFGDPFDNSPDKRPIKLKESPDGNLRVYDDRYDLGYSDRGRLICLRKERIPLKEPVYLSDRVIDDPMRYYFVTADLKDDQVEYDGTWQYMQVIRAEHIKPRFQGLEQVRTDLYLSDTSLEEVPAEILATSRTASITSKLGAAALDAEIEDFWASKPRLSIGHGVTFNQPGRAPEHLHSIPELAAMLRTWGPSIAKALINESLTPVVSTPAVPDAA